MEGSFFAPLQMRIKQRLDNAVNLAETKQTMIDAMDADPVPIRAGRELPPVGNLVVPLGGLADPFERFARKREAEESFERRVNAELGRPIPEMVKPERRRTLDWQAYELRRETRFFDGDESPHHGKRLFRKETFRD
jgi:hypothetical protein